MKPLRRDPIGPLLAADDAALRSMARRELLGETMPRSARRSVPAWAGLSPGSSPMAGGSTRAGTRTSAPGRRMTSWRPTASSACWSCKFGLDRQHPAVAAAAGFLSSCQTEARLDPALPIAPAIVVAQAAISAQSRKSPSVARRASSSARSPNPSLLLSILPAKSQCRAPSSWSSAARSGPAWSASGLGGSPTARWKTATSPGPQAHLRAPRRSGAPASATARRRRRCRGPPRVVGQVADLLDWAHVREYPALPRAIREHVWHHQRARGAEEGHHPLAKVDDLPGSWHQGGPRWWSSAPCDI